MSQPLNNKQKLLLKSLIRESIRNNLLTELEDYSQTALYKAFIEPFTDVIKTAQHGVKKISTSVIGTATSLAKQAALMFVPFLTSKEIARIGKQDRQRIAEKLGRVDAEFKDVLERNWSTLNQLDVWGSLFLVNPGLAIGEKILVKAPEVALELLSTFTGDNQYIDALQKWYNSLRTGGELGKKDVYQAGTMAYGGGGGGGGGDYGGGDMGGFFEEQVVPQQQPSRKSPEQLLTSALQKAMKDPKIRQQIAASPLTRAMQQEAVNTILVDAQNQIGKLTFEIVKQKAGQEFNSIMSKLVSTQKTKDSELNKPEVLEKDPEFQKTVLSDIKVALKTPYINQLKTLVQVNPTIQNIVNKAIQQIQAL